MKISKYDEGQWMLHLSAEEADRLYAALSVSPSPHRNEAMKAISDYFDMGYEPLPGDGAQVTTKVSEKKTVTFYVDPHTEEVYSTHVNKTSYLSSLGTVLTSKALMKKILDALNGGGYYGISVIKEIRTSLKDAELDYSLYVAKKIYDAIHENYKNKGWEGLDPENITFVVKG